MQEGIRGLEMKTLKVNSQENSDCSKDLSKLDWSNWWIDRSLGGSYLHVRCWDEEQETWWRVICKDIENPRVRMVDGELFWLIDEDTKTCTSCGLTYGDVKINFYFRKPIQGKKGLGKWQVQQPCRLCRAEEYEKKTKKIKKKKK